MHRIAFALSFAALCGCATAPSSRDTCNFLAESSALYVEPVRLSQSDSALWLSRVGLSTRSYRSIYWYQNGTDVRLVCLYKTKCKATVRAYRRNGAGWHQFEPPDSGILCVVDAK